MSAPNESQGTCLCGAVSLHVSLAGYGVSICHCRMCQTWSGGPMLAIESDEPMTLEGEENISVYASSDWAERGFCRQCGTHLFYRLANGQHYAFPLGLIDAGEPWTIAQQIFIDEKPSFYDFANDTPRLTGDEVFAQFQGSADS
ncbi:MULTISPECIES: GFA family protein [unclassified Chromohalobacter]|uniref:GFA family protein n=1 Tax=unclassified Chromohalobacter TaxID=2628571 RepID=UPI002468C3CE|nr:MULTISPECIES: GFA family protein [unclassified Chromohalobacter]